MKRILSVIVIGLVSPLLFGGDLHRLIYAGGSLDEIQALIDEGADVNDSASKPSAPIHVAAMYHQNPAVIKVLLEAGADVNAPDEDGWTPLHLAVSFQPHLIPYLIEAGADIWSKTYKGRLPWAYIFVD